MRKTTFCLLLLMLSISLSFGQYIVNFEGADETKTAYASGDVTLSGLSWNLTEVLIGNLATDWKNGTKSARLRGYGTSAMTMLENKTSGLGTLSFYYRRYATDAQVDWKVEYSIDNGSSWMQIGSVFTAPASDTPSLFSEDVNVSGDVRIRIQRATETGTSNNRLNIDDITLTDFTGIEVEPPTLQASNIIAYPANTEITLEWTPGNGARRLVKINTINSFTSPVDGSNLAANDVYSGIGEQVIFNGSTQIVEGLPLNGCNVSGLTPLTTYWFRIYEYNGSGSFTRYNTSESTNNPISAITTNTPGSDYYTGITGYGITLKTNLHNLLRTTHTTRYSYDALWIKLPYTDEDPTNTNNIIEIYTGWSVPKAYYGSGTSQWNREHTWSKSHGNFSETPPAGTDLHHLRPCDSTVNSAKSNKDFDYATTSYYDSSPYNGYPQDTGCKTSTYAWEPRDADKGDVARMIMYMA
ncbi:MAG TPA: endonuclease, partial [Candidatus Cloacimonas sp.]|nr:endonuclease [Candidatus Cloacimonas sp.]